MFSSRQEEDSAELVTMAPADIGVPLATNVDKQARQHQGRSCQAIGCVRVVEITSFSAIRSADNAIHPIQNLQFGRNRIEMIESIDERTIFELSMR